MNQHEWVYGCYAYYLENYIEPGNPEDGEWHDAHWPVPGCLGGTKTILLLKEHHAVQGVLQSEEWGRKCLYGCWEKECLTGDWLDRYNIIMSDHGKRVASVQWQDTEFSSRRNKNNPRCHTIRVIAPDGTTGTFTSVREAARAVDRLPMNVWNWIKRGRPTPDGWRFIRLD
jgi:hypothetical protein